MTTTAPPLSIVADIGGTNTRVALARGDRLQAGSLRHFRNAGRAGLEPILADYLNETGGPAPDLCCVAVAGPVQDGRALMTNLDWRMSEQSLAAATGAGRVVLLNDLQAQGHALGRVAPGRMRVVTDGPVQRGAAMLVVGLGTGVNAAPVHGTGAARVVHPSECGHVGMPVTNDEELALLRYIESLPSGPGRTRRASIEEVLSGRGLGHLHGFVTARDGEDALNVSHDDSHAVLDALAAGDERAGAALALYVRILGQVLGDLALIHLPFGGIFLIGGMARAVAPWLDEFGLTGRFRAPRWIDLLEHEFRVSVIEDDNAALAGCAAHVVQIAAR